MCSTIPYDWTDGGSVDVFLNGEYGFTSMRSRCQSMEWVWNFRTKLCSIASGKRNGSRVSLQGFDIRDIMFYVNQFEYTSVV